MDNIETVQQLYKYFAAKDNQGLKQILDKNIQWNQMKGFPKGGQYTGIDAVLENVFAGFRQDWSSWSATTTRYIDTSEGVFAIGYYEGVYKATGKYMRADFVCVYKVSNGKITAFDQYTDTLLIARAMNLN